VIAYCWATGRIDFGRTLPKGAIEIARGPANPLRKLVMATSRLAYDNETLLVPGAPEAISEESALDALGLHLRWLKRRAPASVTIATKQSALPLTATERQMRRAR
jgi:hypothetical protein